MAGRWSPPLLLAFLFLSVPVFDAANSSDVEGLLKFKTSISDPTGALRSWTAATAPCNKDVENWAGVICDRGRVTGLQLENMNLSGTLDLDALVGLPGLRTLSIMNNEFKGPMPEVAKLKGLKAVYLSNNKFSGAIPADAFAGMAWFKKIHLAHNQFSGPIPSSVADLPKLLELVLNDNKFDGAIPDLRQTGLKRVVLANNNLEGPVPERLSKMAASAFAGNKGLCGAAVGTLCKDVNSPPPSSTDPLPKSSSESTPLVIIGILFAAVLIVVAVILAAPRRKQKNEVQLGRPPSTDNSNSKEYESYKEEKLEEGTVSSEGSTRSRKAGEPPRLAFVKEDMERFELQDLLKSTAEVLGTANFGCTYKATMQSGTSVVVKRYKDMNRVGKEDFDEHMRRLGRLSHPNLLPLVAYYYRKEEKLMITDYISKWSLANVLHGHRDASTPVLNWPARLEIVKGVASGLAYLYDEVQVLSVPHGHLKSSNVLLTNDSFEPLLTDYALLPVMNQAHAAQHMVAFKSPECKQHNKTSKKSDVWTLGVLILEILTGKIPATNLQQGQERVDLPNWVNSVIKEELTGQVFDSQMKASKEDQEEMSKLLHIALACCEPSVEKRWDINEAVDKIDELKANEVASPTEELSVVTI